MPTYTETNPLHPGPVQLAVVAGGGPALPPREWFEDPKLDGPTPLTIMSDGRVYGHLAAWNTDHIGMPGRVRPPRSASGYAYFHSGVVACADGSDVPVGQITLSGGHAPLSADASAAVRHYDDTASAIIDVHAGEDAHGIWLAGALRASATDEQVRALRASAPSGDWRPINGRLELVAACQVNVPGFPIARARVASAAPGQTPEVLALVAAGALDMTMRRFRNADPTVDGRVGELEAVVAGLQAQLEEIQTERVETRKAALREQVVALD